MQHSDEKLLQDYLNGNRDALGVLLQRYLAAFYTLALRRTNHPADAQDLAQDICRRVIESIPTFAIGKPVKPWLFAVAYRTVLAGGQKRLPMTGLPDLDRATPNAGGNAVEQREQQAALERAIAGLPDELQLPVILHYYHKMTYKEIGEVAGCSDANVHKRIHKALDALKLSVGACGVLFTVGQVEGMLQAATLASAPASLATSVSGMAASAPVLAGSATAAAVLTTGGVIMTTKSLAITVMVGVLCLASGFGIRVALEQPTPAEEKTEVLDRNVGELFVKQQTELARLQRAAADKQEELQSLREELDTLKTSVDAKDKEIMALRDELQKTAGQGTAATPAAEDLAHASESVLLERFEEICKQGLNGFNDPNFAKIAEGFKNLGARGVDVLAATLAEHDDMMHRFFAAAILGTTELPEALDPLFAAIRTDKEVLVRRMASHTFFTMDIDKKENALQTLTVLADTVRSESDWGIQVNAFIAWLKHTEKWNQNDPELGADLIALFNQMGDGKNFAMDTLQVLVNKDGSYSIALPLFRHCIQSDEAVSVRTTSLRALVTLKDQNSLEAIENIIFNDSNAGLVKTAKEAYNAIAGVTKYPVE